jgi:Pentapeptide repeats (8 copies)
LTLEKTSQEIIAAIHGLLPGARPRLVAADLRAADLHGQNLSGEDMSTADLTGADLHGANLQGVLLRDADLPGANLTGADLTGANLHGADLCGADLSDVEGLASVDFEYAFADETTVWPERFEPDGKVVIMRSIEDTEDEPPDSLPRRISARLREEARELSERMRAVKER